MQAVDIYLQVWPLLAVTSDNFQAIEKQVSNSFFVCIH